MLIRDRGRAIPVRYLGSKCGESAIKIQAAKFWKGPNAIGFNKFGCLVVILPGRSEGETDQKSKGNQLTKHGCRFDMHSYILSDLVKELHSLFHAQFFKGFFNEANRSLYKKQSRKEYSGYCLYQ